MKKQILSWLLVLAMVLPMLPMLPASVQAADGAQTMPAHTDCHMETAQAVTSFSELAAAVRNGGDIVLEPASGDAAAWNVTETLEVSSGKTVHITVAAGKKITINRDSFKNQLFSVAYGGTLILGDGAVDYTGDSLSAAGESGAYEVKASGGELVIDGGAKWTASNTNITAYFMEDSGERKAYRNTGVSAGAALIRNQGKLDIWGGVTLQNNVRTSGEGSAVNMSNQDSSKAPELNLYGGVIQWCATTGKDENNVGAAIYCGNTSTGWTTKPTERYGFVNLWAGEVKHNANYAAGDTHNGDGTAIALDAATLKLYGGKIAFNCGDTGCGTAAADGGGVGIRMGDAFLYGGEISNNWTGGFGGGMCLWNADATLVGTAITENQAGFGGGVAIAGHSDAGNVNSTLTMTGGTIAYNEAVKNDGVSNSGVGGGICAGTGGRPNGSVLNFSGGTVQQNKAENGGGIGVYAGKVTNVKLSGDVAVSGNSAYQNGSGMYLVNADEGDSHTLLDMSGGARIDTNNPVYIENLIKNQVPVYVSENLTTTGTAAIFEFSQNFWTGTGGSFDHASGGRKIVSFKEGLDIQENKIALDNTSWYLKANSGTGALELQTYNDAPLYTIRNGTPVTVDGLKYYRVYQSLDEATEEAQNGDILYIFYNTTIDTTAKVTGKKLTLLAESSSSAGLAAASSGSGKTKTCWLDEGNGTDWVMEGSFLKYVGSGGNELEGKYRLEGETDTYRYNVRNDYTITLSKALYLGEAGKGGDAGEAAIIVGDGAGLEVGQTATAGMGAGKLTFDGNLSYPKEGPMFQTAGDLTFHDGITVMNHSNYSEAHPGTVEVRSGGVLSMETGVTLKNGVSPVAGAVYVHDGGAFDMKGGSISDNYGAMPRYGFVRETTDEKLTEYDRSYWGQAKYYYGAGAVYNLGSFTMSGGTISGNQGEFGAIATMGNSTLTLSGGAITENHALVGTGDGEYSLKITGYTDAGKPARGTDRTENAGSGGGLYIGGSRSVTVGGSVSISGNTAAENGGGIAMGAAADLTKTVNGYSAVTSGYETTGSGKIAAKVPGYNSQTTPATISSVKINDRAAVTDNSAQRLGGGIYTESAVTLNVTTASAISGNHAKVGGGLAAETAGKMTVDSTVTGNTAENGGGAYVGKGTTVVLQGNLTDNTADNGGGAYVDNVDEPSETTPGSAGNATNSGKLVLSGAYVNNNKINGSGLGVGVYNRGSVELQANGIGANAVQPFASANDRIYLESGYFITLKDSYLADRQSETDKLTVLTRDKSNGTKIAEASSAEQAEQILAMLVHGEGASITRNATNQSIIEINQNTIRYCRETVSDTGDNLLEIAYVPGSQQTLRSYEFETPMGKSFSGWIRVSKDGKHYIHKETGAALALTDTNKELAKYQAGEQITLNEDFYFVADYTNTQYTAKVLVDIADEGTGTAKPADTVSMVSLGGVTTSADGAYSYGMGSQISVNPGVPSEERVLQSVEVYEEAEAGDFSFEDRGVAGTWKKVAWAELEQEHLLLAPKTETDAEISVDVKSTGKITKVSAAEGTTAELIDGLLSYTAYAGNIVVKVTYKEPKVSLTMQDGFVGYYDSPHRARTAMIQRMEAKPEDTKVIQGAQIKLLRADEDTPGIVSYYGKQYGAQLKDRAALTTFSEAFLQKTSDNLASFSFELNGLELNYAGSGRRVLNGYDMTMQHGAVRFESLSGVDDENRPLSGYRVENGTLTLNGVEINVNDPETYYAVKVMDNGNLEVGRACTLGRVFIHSDARDGVEGKLGTDATVLITEEFDVNRSDDDPVATLCMNRWNFGNGERQVFRLSDQPDESGEAMKASVGPNIRRLFRLEDVSDSTGTGGTGQVNDQEPHDKKWFIGTDGMLYRKAAQLVPSLTGLSAPTVGEDIDRYQASWISGYPFYGNYKSQYGESGNVTIQATLLDAYDQPIPKAEGTVSFMVNRVQPTADGSKTISRQTSGMVSPDSATGIAEIAFTHIKTLQANMEQGWYSITASWAGTAQYAPQYAKYWNYNYIDPNTEDSVEQAQRSTYAGYVGNSLTSGLELTVEKRNLADNSITVEAMTPDKAEYIGEKGLEQGYASAPTVGRAQHQMGDTSMNMILGTDANAFYVALTTDPNLAVKENGQQVESCTHDGVTYYYLAGENGGKIYYRTDGSGDGSGSSIDNARKINSAPAGTYRIGLEAETLDSANYMGSGEKLQHFVIEPYSSMLNVTGPNHVLVSEGEDYESRIKSVLEVANGLKITDRYGNVLDPEANCSYSFITVSGSAKLDRNGWPASEGLYSLVVSADAKATDNKLFSDSEKVQDNNYSGTAKGYMAVLITNTPLTMKLLPDRVQVPYSGELYTDEKLKTQYDRGPDEDQTTGDLGEEPPDGYKVVLVEAGTDNVVEELSTGSYRLEIGSPQHMPRDVGIYTLVVTDKTGKYTGIGTLEIDTGTITDITLSEESGIYTGGNHNPDVTVQASRNQEEVELFRNRGYVLHVTEENSQVEVAAPVNAGSYTYQARGVGNYVGNASKTYTVQPKALDNSDCGQDTQLPEVTVDCPEVLYVRNQPISIEYSVFYNGMVLRNSEDFTLKQITKDGQEFISGTGNANNISEAGTYVITIEGKGNYQGTRSFTVDVRDPIDETHKLHVSNTEEFVYSGVTFQGYQWAAGASIEWDATSGQGDTTRTNVRSATLDISRFDFTLKDANGNTVPEDQVLDAGVYIVEAAAKEDYWKELGSTEPLVGNCIMRIKRRQVTVTVESQEKTYGEPDSIQNHYTTDIHVSNGTGFYEHDRDRISGNFSRNSGENVQLGGYRYTLGSFTAGDNYVLLMSMDTVYTINPKDITDASDVTLQTNGTTYAYSGYAPDVVTGARYKGLALGENAQYVLTYEQKIPGGDGADVWVPLSLAPADVGEYRVTVDCDLCTITPDNYIGSKTVEYRISNTSLALTVRVDGSDTVVYDGEAHIPNILVTTAQGNLVNSSNYTITYSYLDAVTGKTTTGAFVLGETSFTHAGNCTLYVSGTGNYAGATGQTTFTIQPKDISDEADPEMKIALTEPDEGYTYTGQPVRAAVEAAYTPDGGTEQAMAADTDYTLAYANHTQAGGATVTVTGRGNYTGSRTLNYTIQKKPVKVTIDASTLTKIYGAVDPAYSYSAEDNEGNPVRIYGTIRRDGAGTAEGEAVGSHELDVSDLTAGSNYELKWDSDPALVITQKPIAEQDGKTPAENISITVPTSVAAENGVTLETLAAQIQAMYWAPAMSVQSLIRDTDYTLEVRTEAGSPVTGGGNLASGKYLVTLTGQGNYTGSYTTEVTVIAAAKMLTTANNETVIYTPKDHKKTFTPQDTEGNTVSGCQIELSVSDVTGNTRKETLIQAADDSVSLTLTDVGTYTVVVTKTDGSDSYYGTVTYTVQPKNVEDEDITVAGVNDSYDYTGEEIRPEATLTHDEHSVPAADGTTVNFVCTYANNVNPSTADKKAAVTIHGQGNYTGTRTVSYQIGETRYSVVYYNSVDEATGTVPTDDKKYPAGGQIIMPASGMSASGLAFMGWTTTEYKPLAQSDTVPTYYAQGAAYTVPEDSTNPIAMYALWGVDSNANGTADCVENTYQLIYHKGSASGTQPETKSYIAGTTAMVDNGSLTLEKFVLMGWTKQAPDSGEEYKFMNAATYNSFTGGVYKAGNPLVMAPEETHLYPVWGVDDDENGRPDWEKPTQRYVRYSANGGTNEPPGVFVPADESETEIAPRGNTPSRADYQFVGWTKEAVAALTRNAQVEKRADGRVTKATVDGTDVTVYQSGDQYAFTEDDGMFVTFYALWAEDRNKNQTPDYEEQTYQVRFKNVMSSVTESNLPDPLPDMLEGETVTLPAQTPRGAYGSPEKTATFLGWTDDQAAAQKMYTRTDHPTVTVYVRGGSYTLPKSMTEDSVTLYALWGDADYNKAEYTVMAAVVHGKGSVKVEPERVLHGDTCTVTITPEAGYQLSQVMVNGVAQANPSTSMQLTITQDTNVVVSFVQSSSSAQLTPEKRTYNGVSQPPTLTVKDGETVLRGGTDYTVKVNGAQTTWNAAFVNAGTYTITVEGQGAYAGNTHTLRYVIEPANIAVQSNKTSFAYDGSAKSPEVTVTGVRGAALTKDVDYTVTYQTASGTPVTEARNAASYVAIYTGKGNYTGSVRVPFQITPNARSLTVTGLVSRTYNGEPYHPEPLVSVNYRGLQKDQDYTLSYVGGTQTDVGTYTVQATGKGNYQGRGSANYRVVAKKLDDSDNAGSIEVIVADAVYDGTEQKPMVVVTYTTAENRVLYLTEGKDYSCTYRNNVNVFTGESGAQAPTVSITGKGNYTGTITKNFKITGKTFTDVQSPPAKTYNGQGQVPAAGEIVVKDGGTTLRQGTHYDITEYVPLADGAALDDSGKPRNAGTYTILIKGRDGGNYAGYAGTATFVIRPAALTKLEISESYAPVYDGTAQTPESGALTVSSSVSETLQADRDYTLVYQNNENAGNATVTAVGKGNYTGTVSSAFTIQKAKLLIEPVSVTKTYGTEDTLSFQLAENTHSISAGDLSGSLTRAPGEAAGTYDILLNTLSDPTGNYTLELTGTKTFTIEPKSIAEDDVQSETKETTEVVVGYTGVPYRASPTIVYGSDLGNLLLARAFSEDDAKDYRITYNGSADAPTEAGTYTVQVEGIGNYTGTYTYTLKITEDMAGAVLTDGDQKIYNGSNWVDYIQGNLQVSIPGTPDPSGQYTLQYFAAEDTDRAEALTEIRNAGVYTIVVTPMDTSVQPVDVSFTVLRKDIADSTVSVSPIADQTYAGSAVMPEVTLQDDELAAALDADADYTVTYQGNVNVGTAQAVISGTGNYTGTRAEPFTIQANSMGATVSGLTDVVYNGLPQWQRPSVESGGVTLRENVDYVLGYSNDTVNVGTVTVTVTGIGNYTGTLGSGTYRITPKPIQAAWIQGIPEAVTYTGAAQTPVATVRDPDLYTLTEGMDYTISYAGNTNVGTASITVVGRGNFQGTARKNFEIQANSGAFVVQPSRSVIYNGKDQKPQLTVSINGRTVNASEYTATYRYNGGTAAAFNNAKFVNVGVYMITVTGTGGYQNASGTAMFAITPGSFTAGSVPAQDYTGKSITPTPTVKDGSRTLTAGVDYTLAYKNNIQIGTATISIVGRGNYAGCVRTVNFKIVGERTAFRVTYHGNGNTMGTVPTDSATYVQGNRVTVRSAAENFSRHGAVFLGWSAVRSDLLTSQAQQDAASWYQPGSSFIIAGNTTLYALWAADQNHNGKPDYSERVTITASAGEGGTISPAGQTTLEWGAAQAEFTVKADTGYAFSGVTVDGQLVHVSTPDQPTALRRNEDGTYTYTFTNIQTDHVIVGTFRAGGTPDSPTDPADSGVSELLDTSRHNAYMQGRGENQFWPDANITRAEVTMIFYRLLRNQDVPITTTFSDVNEDAWYADAVNTLASLGIVNGYPDGSFRPDQSITRGEFATITARLAYSADTGVVVNFSDVAADTWYYDNIQLNAYYGWVQGYPDGSFRPERNIARSEATKIVNYMTGRIADQAAIDSGMGTRFVDVADTHWAFYHITEAATDHDFIREDTIETWK